MKNYGSSLKAALQDTFPTFSFTNGTQRISSCFYSLK